MQPFRLFSCLFVSVIIVVSALFFLTPYLAEKALKNNLSAIGFEEISYQRLERQGMKISFHKVVGIGEKDSPATAFTAEEIVITPRVLIASFQTIWKAPVLSIELQQPLLGIFNSALLNLTKKGERFAKQHAIQKGKLLLLQGTNQIEFTIDSSNDIHTATWTPPPGVFSADFLILGLSPAGWSLSGTLENYSLTKLLNAGSDDDFTPFFSSTIGVTRGDSKEIASGWPLFESVLQLSLPEGAYPMSQNGELDLFALPVKDLGQIAQLSGKLSGYFQLSGSSFQPIQGEGFWKVNGLFLADNKRNYSLPELELSWSQDSSQHKDPAASPLLFQAARPSLIQTEESTFSLAPLSGMVVESPTGCSCVVNFDHGDSSPSVETIFLTLSDSLTITWSSNVTALALTKNSLWKAPSYRILWHQLPLQRLVSAFFAQNSVALKNGSMSDLCGKVALPITIDHGFCSGSGAITVIDDRLLYGHCSVLGFQEVTGRHIPFDLPFALHSGSIVLKMDDGVLSGFADLSLISTAWNQRSISHRIAATIHESSYSLAEWELTSGDVIAKIVCWNDSFPTVWATASGAASSSIHSLLADLISSSHSVEGHATERSLFGNLRTILLSMNLNGLQPLRTSLLAVTDQRNSSLTGELETETRTAVLFGGHADSQSLEEPEALYAIVDEATAAPYGAWLLRSSPHLVPQGVTAFEGSLSYALRWLPSYCELLYGFDALQCRLGESTLQFEEMPFPSQRWSFTPTAWRAEGPLSLRVTAPAQPAFSWLKGHPDSKSPFHALLSGSYSLNNDSLSVEGRLLESSLGTMSGAALIPLENGRPLDCAALRIDRWLLPCGLLSASTALASLQEEGVLSIQNHPSRLTLSYAKGGWQLGGILQANYSGTLRARDFSCKILSGLFSLSLPDGCCSLREVAGSIEHSALPIPLQFSDGMWSLLGSTAHDFSLSIHAPGATHDLSFSGSLLQTPSQNTVLVAYQEKLNSMNEALPPSSLSFSGGHCETASLNLAAESSWLTALFPLLSPFVQKKELFPSAGATPCELELFLEQDATHFSIAAVRLPASEVTEQQNESRLFSLKGWWTPSSLTIDKGTLGQCELSLKALRSGESFWRMHLLGIRYGEQLFAGFNGWYDTVTAKGLLRLTTSQLNLAPFHTPQAADSTASLSLGVGGLPSNTKCRGSVSEQPFSSLETTGELSFAINGGGLSYRGNFSSKMCSPLQRHRELFSSTSPPLILELEGTEDEHVITVCWPTPSLMDRQFLSCQVTPVQSTVHAEFNNLAIDAETTGAEQLTNSWKISVKGSLAFLAPYWPTSSLFSRLLSSPEGTFEGTGSLKIRSWKELLASAGGAVSWQPIALLSAACAETNIEGTVALHDLSVQGLKLGEGTCAYCYTPDKGVVFQKLCCLSSENSLLIRKGVICNASHQDSCPRITLEAIRFTPSIPTPFCKAADHQTKSGGESLALFLDELLIDAFSAELSSKTTLSGRGTLRMLCPSYPLIHRLSQRSAATPLLSELPLQLSFTLLSDQLQVERLSLPEEWGLRAAVDKTENFVRFDGVTNLLVRLKQQHPLLKNIGIASLRLEGSFPNDLHYQLSSCEPPPLLRKWLLP